MRLRINHETRYTYTAPPRHVTQLLRLTPRSHEGQYVRRWRVEADADVRLFTSTDGLGNPIHHLTIDGEIDGLTVTASGEVDVEDTSGVVRGTREPLPPAVFLRDTALTEPDEALRELAPRPGADVLTSLHDLMRALRDRMSFETGQTDARTTAAQALASGRGVCQDFTHAFLAAARAADIPARYVSGHLHQLESTASSEAAHAWAEALVPNLGWVGFDAANGVSVDDHYVRVATGFDALSGAPLRGAQGGGQGEDMTVTVSVTPVERGASGLQFSQMQQ